MIDFLRLVGGPLVGLLILLGVLWIILPMILKNIGGEAMSTIRIVRRVISILAVAGFVLYTFQAASVNVVPRGQLDRSIVNERVQDFDKKVHEPAPVETPKQEGGK